MRCPVCCGPTNQLFTHSGYGIRACEICGHRTVEISPVTDHVTRTYSDNYFEGGGEGYQNYTSEAELLIAHGRQYGSIMANYVKAGRVLDVGAAAGFVLKGFMETGWHGEGVEPNARMADYARTRLGVPVTACSLENFHLSSTPFDLVSMIQVVAHFIDPRIALRVADSATRLGGHWLVETWNRESWTARLFGKHWHEYSPPSVLHWFSPDGLSRLAAEFGFREVARGKPRKWISGRHAKSLIRYKLKDSHLSRPFAGLARLIPDSASLPYPSEDLFWIMFQKI